MITIGIILGSTRPGRNGEAVARWAYELARTRNDAKFELVDLKDFNLPHLDEALPPSLGQYAKDHTKAWAATIARFDGFVFVTPEYNHSTSGALNNAIDFLYGFVVRCYGYMYGLLTDRYPTFSDDPVLTLPHPRAHERAFVLAPWHDIDAAAVVPGQGAVATLLVGRLAAGDEVTRRDDLRLGAAAP